MLIKVAMRDIKMLTVDEKNFEKEVLKSDILVVVDFYADWCMPCKMLAPVFEEVSKEFEGVKFVKVDTEVSKGLAQDFSVMGFPTIMFIKDGKEVHRIVGFVEKEKLKEEVGRLV